MICQFILQMYLNIILWNSLCIYKKTINVYSWIYITSLQKHIFVNHECVFVNQIVCICETFCVYLQIYIMRVY